MPGEDWHFPGCYGQGGDVCEGAPSPVAELDQHAAVSDVAIVTGQLGARVGIAAIVAEWAKGLVLMVPLAVRWLGSDQRAEDPAHWCAEPGRGALAGPDGALLVADWASGTVYRISPTSHPALTTS